MGFISKSVLDSSVQEAVQRGRTLWREAFGNVSRIKEEAYKPPPVLPGGSYGRSMVGSGGAAYKRLVQAMRSLAPGGWSDDRWEQGSGRHFLGIPYACIHRKCTMLSQSEFQLFRKDPRHPDGKVPVFPGDPAYDVVELLEKPNPHDTWGKWLYRLGQQKDLTGTALDWLVPNQLGQPMEMYIIPTAIAIPQPAINPDFPDGYYRIQPVYPYGPFSTYPTPTTAVGAPISAKWMIRFQYPHPLLRYDGYSPMTAMKNHIDALEMVDRSRWYKMKKSFNPAAVADSRNMEGSQPLPEEEIERMRVEFENSFQSPENAGKLIVMPPGMELNEFGSRPVDMDFPTSWDQLVDFISGSGFGMPKGSIGMLNEVNYATLFALMKMVYLFTLQPEVDDIAADLTRHLLPYFGDGLVLEIRCKRIDDHDIINGKLALLMQASAITKNEVRKLLDLPLTNKPWGEDVAGMPPPPEFGDLEEAPVQEDESMREDGRMSEEPESEASRPNPSMIGSQGQRNLNGYSHKSFSKPKSALYKGKSFSKNGHTKNRLFSTNGRK